MFLILSPCSCHRVRAIDKVEATVAQPEAHEIGEAIHELVAHAARDYDKALEGGKVADAHEHRAAVALLRAAEHRTDRVEAAGADAKAVEKVREQLAAQPPALTSAEPPTGAADPSVLYGAAARIEIAVQHL